MTDLQTPTATDADLFELINTKLYTAVIGDILDKLSRVHQFLPPQIRPLTPSMRVAGRAMPVLVADVFSPQRKPFGLLTEALDQLRPGEVYLAPRTGAQAQAAMWGEILTATAQSRGAVGAVVDGYHRDTTKVLGQGFPVFSHGNYAQDSSIRTIVHDFRVPVEISGVHVTPGDLVVGDIDGVLVIPQDIEAEVIEAALEKASTENLVRVAIEDGMSSTEAFARFGVL
ncbi:RraA family protein [Microbacterium sp. 2FI]|uniref:RraA family protein n=1 Tax=Microbacterium sp. 2FI TaxID=2502193 RepID=UPI0010F7E85D|nr:RraA family protein [Microbacterium sp. 2FI]